MIEVNLEKNFLWVFLTLCDVITGVREKGIFCWLLPILLKGCQHEHQETRALRVTECLVHARIYFLTLCSSYARNYYTRIWL
jgi:hypothetical protein